MNWYKWTFCIRTAFLTLLTALKLRNWSTLICTSATLLSMIPYVEYSLLIGGRAPVNFAKNWVFQICMRFFPLVKSALLSKTALAPIFWYVSWLVVCSYLFLVCCMCLSNPFLTNTISFISITFSYKIKKITIQLFSN